MEQLFKLDKVSKVELVFENSEEISIPLSDIGYLTVGNIKQNIRINPGFGKESCRVEHSSHADSFHIRFKNKPEYKRVFDFTDVAQIHFYDNDGNSDWLFAPWESERYDFVNGLQDTSVRGDFIEVTISEENLIKDISEFDDENDF